MEHTKVFSAMKEEMEKGNYTLAEANQMIGIFLTHKQITRDEYDELYSMLSTLELNSPSDEEKNWKVNVDDRLSNLENRVKFLEEALLITPEPDPEEPAGTEDDPIEAYRGLVYYKDKYYHDSEDLSLYLCTRDSEIQLFYMPHELIGHYFDKVTVQTEEDTI